MTFIATFLSTSLEFQLLKIYHRTLERSQS
uniref:Uncharacterized protein n=1 Tax=Arundo donax TaxID=35708 RepID=A0A0A9GXW2_ARUDO